jgi:flagellar hook-length control protein FliK
MPQTPQPWRLGELPELLFAAKHHGSPAIRTALFDASATGEPAGMAASYGVSQTLPPASQSPASPAGPSFGAEHARIVAPQIVAAITADPGSGRIHLRLDPPELGAVEISLEITDQALRATLAAERPATGDLLRRHAEILLSQLQQAGFSGVDLRFFAGQQGGGHSNDAPQPTLTDLTDPLPPRDAPETAMPATRRTAVGLDMRV